MSYAENFGKQKKVLNKKGFEKEIKIIIGSPIQKNNDLKNNDLKNRKKYRQNIF